MSPIEWVETYQARLEAKIKPRAMGDHGATGFRMHVSETLLPDGGYVIFSITTYNTKEDRDAAAKAEGTSEFRYDELKAVGCEALPVEKLMICTATDLDLSSPLA
ncbi:MAG TPA: hypothetical protein VH144_02955 [Candidatus Saccharimonadales bacterium]|nr:hypothetical protein [Candidatus Saccharimonadales bacterium]